MGDDTEEIFSVLIFLFQRDVKHLSVLQGGYGAFHEQALSHSLEILNHSSLHCYLCQANHLSSVKKIFKTTKQEAEIKLFKITVNK